MLAIQRGAAMGDQIDLAEAGRGDVPAASSDRDVVLEERAGLGAAVLATSELLLVGLQAAVDGARADGQHLALDVGGDRPAALGPGQPQRQEGFQADRPGIAGGFPNRLQHGERRGPVGGRRSALAGGVTRRGTGEHPDGRFPMAAQRGTHLAQDLAFGALGGLGVAQADGREVLALGRRAHG